MSRLLLAATTALILIIVANAIAGTPEVRVKFRRGATSEEINHFVVHSVNGMETQAIETTSFEEVLPENRDYRIRVGMTRAAARRKGAVADYRLRIEIR